MSTQIEALYPMARTRSITFVVMSLLVMQFAAAEDDDAPADEFSKPLDQTVAVADEVVAAKPQPQTPVASEEQLIEEFAHYRRLIADGILDEANVAAKRIVEMAIKVFGPRSRETASALNNLGIVQHHNTQFDAAIQNFTSAVEIIELAEDDRLHGALVNPLKGLGAAQLGNGNANEARKTFSRAAHITQVNDGPHNTGQIEILESIAETFIRLGDMKSARDILDRIHIINVKHFESDPMGLLPPLMTRAGWQHRAGFYAEERATYRQAIRIIESSDGKDSAMLVEPLRRLGESFYFVDLSMATPRQQGSVSTGEIYFRRAVRVADRAEGIDWRVVAQSRVSLADYYIFIDNQSRARKTYQATWDYLSTDEERIALRDEWFTNPVPIQEDDLPTVAGRGAAGDTKTDELLTGKIIVSYNVTARGRIRDMRTEATPIEFTDMQRMVHREIRSRAYRPRLIDGEAVAVADLVFEHEFSYLQADLDMLIEAKAEADSRARK